MNYFSTSIQRTRVLFYVMCLIFALSVGKSMLHDSGDDNLYVLQARSFTEGRLDIDTDINDVAVYDGKLYVTFPPFPAILITPFVFIFDNFNPTFFAFLSTVLLMFVLYSLFKRIGVATENRYWLIMAFVFGTGYWFVAKFSFVVWSFAHTIAVITLFLAIRESFGKSRAWLLGVLLGLAFLTRHLSIYTSVFLIAMIIDKHENLWNAAKDIAVFAIVALSVAGIYFWMNYIRFGNPLDTGYEYITAIGPEALGDSEYGLFHVKYFLRNFVYMFFQGPHLNFNGLVPTNMDYFGTSLTMASPFVFLALKARGKKIVLWGAWLTISMVLIHMLFYHNNGWVQVNTQRFTLDFLPVMMVLVGLSLRHLNIIWLKITAIFAISLNIYSFLVVPILIAIMS